MLYLIDTNKPWFFDASESPTPNVKQATITSQNDRITITAGEIIIELDSYDSKRNELRGRFTVKGRAISADIVIQIENNGKRLVGDPEGFNHRKTWTFESK